MKNGPLPLNFPTDWVQYNVADGESCGQRALLSRDTVEYSKRTRASNKDNLNGITIEAVSASIKSYALDTFVGCLSIRKDWHARMVSANKANSLYSQNLMLQKRTSSYFDHPKPSGDLILRGCLSDIEPNLSESYPQVAS